MGSQSTVDALAGFGDTLSFGISNWARGQLANYLYLDNNTVNTDSNAYLVGEVGAIIADLAGGAAAGIKAAGRYVKYSGLEYSHWIPRRSLPEAWRASKTIFNGNFVPKIEHALSDPFRYRFMPKAWKALNELPHWTKQQWVRIPKLFKGIGAGAGLGQAQASAQANKQAKCPCP
jgi:hypothetical protein